MPSLRARRLRSIFVATGVALLSACAPGTAPDDALLTVDHDVVDLGLRIGDSGIVPADTLVVTNRGARATGALLRPDFAPEATTGGFSVLQGTPGNCHGADLAVGEQCTIIITLGGTQAGPQLGELLLYRADRTSPALRVRVKGAIRAALAVYDQGRGAGRVTAAAETPSAGCTGSCSTSGPGAQCTGVCTLYFDGATATLIATPDADSQLDGFIRGAATPCMGAVADRCTIRLADLDAVSVAFSLKPATATEARQPDARRRLSARRARSGV
jgi:hypothetical protein